MTPYQYVSNNPIMRVDPDGMHDYKLGNDGSFTLLKTTNDKFDKIFNKDESDSIEVQKSFLFTATINYNRHQSRNTPKAGSKGIYNLGSDASDKNKSERIFKFFADNTRNEYGLHTFKDTKTGKSSGFLSTSFESGFERSGGSEIHRRMENNPNLVMTRDIHSHPSGGKYSFSDYPSGFHPVNDQLFGNPGLERYPLTRSKDSGYYYSLKEKYGNRIPSNFEIYVPKAPTVRIFYNDKKATRTDNGIKY